MNIYLDSTGDGGVSAKFDCQCGGKIIFVLPKEDSSPQNEISTNCSSCNAKYIYPDIIDELIDKAFDEKE